MPFPLPNPGPGTEPMQFATIPANGATPSKLFIKNTQNAWVFDGTTVTEVTDADYPATTVWGVAYLDGTVYVMDSAGVIFGSDILAPTSWNALNFISANSEGDLGVAITRHLSYIVAMKQRSIEVFYDAGNPAPGSPLSKMTNALMEVGCASADSIAYNDNTIFFMSNSLSKGRSVVKMDGLTPQYVSDQYIDRLLNADDLATVNAFMVKVNGHVFYVLTLGTSQLTLVYDEITKLWHRWTGMVEQASVAITTTLDATTGITTATTASPNTLADGDLVQIESQRLYITVVDSTHFTFIAPVAVAASTTYITWAESNFPFMYYTRGTDADLLISKTGGSVFEFDTDVYQDDGDPINANVRTALTDWGVMRSKRFNRLEIVGDVEDTTLEVRHSDDDYQTWSQYRQIDTNADRAQIRRLGMARRRAFEVKHMDNTALRLLALEVDIDVGAR